MYWDILICGVFKLSSAKWRKDERCPHSDLLPFHHFVLLKAELSIDLGDFGCTKWNLGQRRARVWATPIVNPQDSSTPTANHQYISIYYLTSSSTWVWLLAHRGSLVHTTVMYQVGSCRATQHLAAGRWCRLTLRISYRVSRRRRSMGWQLIERNQWLMSVDRQPGFVLFFSYYPTSRLNSAWIWFRNAEQEEVLLILVIIS